MLPRVRKWIGIALVLTMLAAAPLPAGAAVMGGMLTAGGGGGGVIAYQVGMDVELFDEQKQVLEKIYEIIPELKELMVISVSSDGMADTWSVYFSETQDMDAIPFAADARLTFEAGTGELLGFNMHNPAWASEEMPSRELARWQADAFIRQLLGDQADQYQIGGFGIIDSGSSDAEGNEISWRALSVEYYPLVNGIPFLSRMSRVGVDAVGRVTSYDRYDRYDQTKQILDYSLFPPAQAAVSLAEAEKSLAEKTTMQLSYLVGYPYFKQDSPLLAYMADSPGYIDALTGEPAEMFAVWQTQQKQIKLVGQGEKMIARSWSEAEMLLSRQFGVDMSKMDFEEQAEGDYWFPGEKMVRYSWRISGSGEQPDGALPDYVILQTLVDSGEVISFDLLDYSIQGKQGVLSQEEALTVARSFLERVLPAGETEMQLTSIWSDISEILPDWVDQTLIDQEYLREPQEFGFNFGRMYQGIPVAGASYSVTVSLVTGEITNYSHNPVIPDTLPDSSQAVSAEQAKVEYLKNTPLQMAYIWPELFGQRAPVPLLVYAPQTTMDWHFIDALTGKVVLFDPTAN